MKEFAFIWFLILMGYAIGLGIGYGIWGGDCPENKSVKAENTALYLLLETTLDKVENQQTIIDSCLKN